jgi:endonuclease/exonuclease/phosphatase family metal-dependent hydrolase
MKKTTLLFLIFFISCNSLVTTFEDNEPAIEYSAKNISLLADSTKNNISVMTWNIRFGAGRTDWFGDHCGDRVILTEAEIKSNLDQIITHLNDPDIDIDILLLQEIDVDSKRSAYIDEVQYILDNTHLNYGVFASMWQAQVIPSDGLGRVNTGNAILSRWKLKNPERIQLDLMTDQDALTQYFYLRRNILKAEIEIPEKDPFFVVNTHLTAFATDDTKKKHVEKYITTLDEINSFGNLFVSGGDLNSLPPINSGESIPDFCNKDKCTGEIWHNETDGGPHKSGSYFEYDETENSWLQPLYDNYTPGIPYNELFNDTLHFTHSPGISLDLDRKLDYLFTNLTIIENERYTLQQFKEISDHVPVMMILDLTSEEDE